MLDQHERISGLQRSSSSVPRVVQTLPAQALPLQNNATIVCLPLGGKDSDESITTHAVGRWCKPSLVGFHLNEVDELGEFMVHGSKGVHHKGSKGASGLERVVVILGMLGLCTTGHCQTRAGRDEVGGGSDMNARQIRQDGLMRKVQLTIGHQ